jgi:hypothetical protein
MNELSFKMSIPHFVLPWLAWLYVQFLAITSRITVKSEGKYPGPAIYACWHCQQVLTIYLQRNRGMCGLVSKSKDGEYMARILKLFGFSIVRGSTTSGGFTSLRALIKAARGGCSLAITPDGPRGPVFKVKPGAIYLAKKAGIPIIPTVCMLSKKKIIRSWYRFQFPLPFGRIHAVYGAPLFVAATDDIAAKAVELENILNSLTEEAQQNLLTVT